MNPESKRLMAFAAIALALLLPGDRRLRAQAATTKPDEQALPTRPQSGDSTTIDRIVAVVNGDLVLESDVDEERRFEMFQPLTEPGAGFSRRRAVERLINRALILQQIKLQPQAPVTDKEIDEQLLQIRKNVPLCKAEHCDTDAGWKQFLVKQGFTLEELRERWKERMEVLRFIEQRFRMGVRISDDEVKTYYDKTLLPQYAQQKVAPPKLAAISDRIKEVLLQQQVSSLLSDWLKSLRAQGTVRIVEKDEASIR